MTSWRIHEIECSPEVVWLTQQVAVPQWARVRFSDTSGHFADFTARAEIVGWPKRPQAIVTELLVGDGASPVKAAQLRELAKAMPDMPAEVLVRYIINPAGEEGSGAAFVRAMRSALRQSFISQTDTEDAVLAFWEDDAQPRGISQREAAEEFGKSHSTFRTYLAHARARRGVSDGRS